MLHPTKPHESRKRPSTMQRATKQHTEKHAWNNNLGKSSEAVTNDVAGLRGHHGDNADGGSNWACFKNLRDMLLRLLLHIVNEITGDGPCGKTRIAYLGARPENKTGAHHAASSADNWTSTCGAKHAQERSTSTQERNEYTHRSTTTEPSEETCRGGNMRPLWVGTTKSCIGLPLQRRLTMHSLTPARRPHEESITEASLQLPENTQRHAIQPLASSGKNMIAGRVPEMTCKSTGSCKNQPSAAPKGNVQAHTTSATSGQRV